MSTLLTPRPSARDRLRFPTARQERLFGDGEAARDPRPVATAAPAPAPASAPPAATVASPTLDTAITRRWERLVASAVAACPVCDSPMEPRQSAASGVVGGRCRACGSTLA
jgi:hypothetical protein